MSLYTVPWRRGAMVALLCLLTMVGSQSLLQADPGTASQGTRIVLPLIFRPTQPRPLPSIFGVSTRTDIFTQTQAIRNLNPGWVRASIRWYEVEPTNRTPDRFDWSLADFVVASAVATGAEPLMLLWGNPAWAASTTCGRVDRVGEAEVAEWITTVVERYDGDGDRDAPGRPVVNVYQFYNEPDWTDRNNDIIGGCWGNEGAAYADFMRVAYRAAHAASPNVVVTNGPLAAEPLGLNAQGQPIFNFRIDGDDFVDDFLEAGGGQFLDGFSFNYFHFYHDRWDRYDPDIAGKVEYFRDRRLRRYELEELPIYISETSRTSDPLQVIDGVAGSLAVQRDYLPKVYVRALDANVRAVLWYTLTDYDGRAWGLLDFGGQPKPSYHAFRVMTSELAEMQSTECELDLADDVEAYLFQKRTNPAERVIVLWSEDAERVPVSLPGTTLRLVNVEGQLQTIADGSAGDRDGRVDGEVTFNATGAPLYVRGFSSTQTESALPWSCDGDLGP